MQDALDAFLLGIGIGVIEVAVDEVVDDFDGFGDAEELSVRLRMNSLMVVMPSERSMENLVIGK